MTYARPWPECLDLVKMHMRSVVLPSYQDRRTDSHHTPSTHSGRSMVAVRPTFLPLSVFHVAWTMCTSHHLRPHLCCIWWSKFIKPNHQEVTTRPRDGIDVSAPRCHLGIQRPRWLQTLLHDRQSDPIPTTLVGSGETPTPCWNPRLSVPFICESEYHHGKRLPPTAWRFVDNLVNLQSLVALHTEDVNTYTSMQHAWFPASRT